MRILPSLAYRPVADAAVPLLEADERQGHGVDWTGGEETEGWDTTEAWECLACFGLLTLLEAVFLSWFASGPLFRLVPFMFVMLGFGSVLVGALFVGEGGSRLATAVLGAGGLAVAIALGYSAAAPPIATPFVILGFGMPDGARASAAASIALLQAAGVILLVFGTAMSLVSLRRERATPTSVPPASDIVRNYGG